MSCEWGVRFGECKVYGVFFVFLKVFSWFELGVIIGIFDNMLGNLGVGLFKRLDLVS